jgi:hypothetical protein
VALQRALEQVVARRPDARRFDLEAALLHSRTLVDFFWAPIRQRRPHRDGIYAAHYVPPWPAALSNLPRRPNESYDAISAQLAHLSVGRIAGNGVRDFDAEIDAIGADLMRVWDRWRADLNGSAWARQLDAALATFRAQP